MLRIACGVAVLGGLGWMMVPGGYSRTVDRPPAEVAAGLAHLDIRDAPGSPGTDSMASGGTLPSFALESAPDHVSYIVMANGEVATKMTAWLTPVDGGARTKVTATVERGSAPDDYVSPVFRSNGLTMGLFSTVLEDELDKLVFKIGPWDSHCDAIIDNFEARNIGNLDQRSPTSLTSAFAGTAKAAMSIAALDKELKAAGCPPNANGDAPRDAQGFTTVSNQLGNAPSAPILAEGSPSSISEATRPTTDLSRYR